MAVNNLTFEQSSTFLNALYKEATGQQSTLQISNTGDFTTVAQAVLKTGYDNVINSISQILGRTIFSVRPYTAKFRGISVDSQKWGAITRKINYIDSDVVDDQRLPLTDGASVDMYTVKKPKVIQTNFYGAHMFQDYITIFRDQLDTAFRNADEFSSFISGAMQNMSDKMESFTEAESRSTLINFICGKAKGDTANYINVLQEYYNRTGTQITPETMWNETNYVPFIKWFYSYINTLTDRMADRTIKYHMNVTGKPIMRHTPADRLKAYMSSEMLNSIASSVLSSVFNSAKLKMIDWESVSYWQNIDDPTSVYAKSTYLNATDGSLTTDSTGIQVNNILGVLFDEDALGITRMSTWTQATPPNAAGGYYNIYYHFTQRTWNDFTENGVVLYAGDVTE